MAAIDAQVAELGDLGDLQARVHHARQLEQSAKQAKDDYAAAHLDELRAAIEPDAEAAVAGVVDPMATLHEAATPSLGLARRIDGLKATDRTRRRLRVPAIDTASDLVNLSRELRPPAEPHGAAVSLAGQRALARLFGLTVDDGAALADPAPTGLEWIGGVPFPATDTPPPSDDTAPDFDGGPRDPEPAPVDPEHDHGQLLADLLREGEGF